MSRSYSFANSVTSPNSATLPICTIISAITIRPKLYDVVMGSSSAPADHSGRFNITRCSTTGTPGSSPTPAPIDPADPAALTTNGLAVFTSTPPTLGNVMLQWALNQKNTMRWQAREGKEIVAPATASNGLAFMNPVVDSTFLVDFTLEYEE